MPKPGVIADLKQRLVDPAQPSANLVAMLDSASRFNGEAGQTLSLKLTAKSEVTRAQFLGPFAFVIPGALAGALEKFTLEASVTH